MKYFWVPLSLFFFFFSCGTDSTSDHTNENAKPKDENAILNRMSADLIPNARTQAEQDQNVIASYCIDHMLDMQKTSSGLYYEIEKEGKGSFPTATSKLTVHYEGRLLDGTVFDSSYKRGQPLELQIGQVIKGWQEGLRMLKPGGQGIFLIPSGLAYGVKGFGKLIPPNTVLLFKVELVSVK